MDEFETYEDLVDERYVEVYYNGGIQEGEDPYDYIDVKEVVKHG